MPRLLAPLTDSARASLLSQAILAAESAAGHGTPIYIGAELLESIDTFLHGTPASDSRPAAPGYAALLNDLKAARAACSRQAAIARTDHESLELYVRDFAEGLKRRTVREKHSPAVLNYFHLPQNGAIPRLDNRAALYRFARHLIEGERSAVAAQFPPMANPTADQVATALSRAEESAAAILPLETKVESALKSVRELRPRAIELCDDVIADLQYRTRKLQPGTARDVMRRYGVKFELTEHAAPEESDTETAEDGSAEAPSAEPAAEAGT